MSFILYRIYFTGKPIDAIMKHKGIRPTIKTDSLLNSTTMAEMIENNAEIKVPQRLMIRNKQIGGVRSHHTEKRLRVTFSKRMWPEKPDSPSKPIGSKA